MAQLNVVFSTDGGSTFSNTGSVTVGNTISVGVYLEDSDTNGPVATDGLLGFGIIGDLLPQNLGLINNTAIDAAFGIRQTGASSSVKIDWEAATFIMPPSGSPVLLGTFDYQSTAAGTSVIDFSDKRPGSSSADTDWASGTGVELDETIFGAGATGTFSFSINSVDDCLLGDVNLDGTVDFLDISPLINVLSNNLYQKEADIDQSGIVSFLDIAPFIVILANQ